MNIKWFEQNLITRPRQKMEKDIDAKQVDRASQAEIKYCLRCTLPPDACEKLQMGCPMPPASKSQKSSPRRQAYEKEFGTPKVKKA